MSTPAPQHAPPGNPAKRTGRNTELVLLGFALGLVTVALVIVQTAQEQKITADLAKYVAAYAVLFAGAHLVVRRLAPYADPLILPIVAVLNGLGLVMIHRLDLGSGHTGETVNATESTHNADQQLLWAVLGLIAFTVILFFVRDHRTLSRYAYIMGVCSLALLAAPAMLSFLPGINTSVNGSKNWIVTPVFSIQPSEFAKILMIIFTASFLVSKRDLFTTAGKHFLGMDFPRPRDLGPLLAAWGLSLGVLVYSTDLGSSLLIFATMLAMLYVATERVSWVVLGVTLFILGALVAYQLFSHLQLRVSIWRDPFADFAGDGYQLAQSLFGLATGGLFGTGLGSDRKSVV